MTDIWKELSDGIEQLADRVIEGEVVFFIGAGFSSEGNSGPRLVGRLLVRLLSFIKYLKQNRVSLGSELENIFNSMFKIEEKDLAALDFPNNITSWLSGRYYVFNDWVIKSYADILYEFKNNKTLSLKEACKYENDYLLKIGDKIQLMDFSPDFVNNDIKDLAKILFLDTLGIGDEKIMAPKPEDKLCLRHHVLARLARGGLCPTLLTANYDMLVETAYQSAGYSYQDQDEDKNLGQLFHQLGCTAPKLVRVGTGLDFFEQARNHKTAHIIKFHGCADSYRRSKKDNSVSKYLPSIVFTYREIQNWRDDAWSRDYISTLLRTRTLVFCGYSAQDPVIHDTFRNVYEEMKRRRDLQKPARCIVKGAPAFAFGKYLDFEFHRSEVLRAASLAIGIDLNTVDKHPNYLPIYYTQCPTMDDAFLWLYHRVQRKQQLQHLKRELPPLLRHSFPIPTSKINIIIENFKVLCDEEEKIPKKDKHAREMLITQAWTWDFHPALLREFAYSVSYAYQNPNSTPINYDLLRSKPWIFPASDRPDWSTWGVIIELALRNLVKQCGKKGWIEPVRGPHPSVNLVFNKDRPLITQVVVKAVVQQNPFPNRRREGGNGLELTIPLKSGSFFPDAQSELSAPFLLDCAQGNITKGNLPKSIEKIWGET